MRATEGINVTLDERPLTAGDHARFLRALQANLAAVSQRVGRTAQSRGPSPLRVLRVAMSVPELGGEARHTAGAVLLIVERLLAVPLPARSCALLDAIESALGEARDPRQIFQALLTLRSSAAGLPALEAGLATAVVLVGDALENDGRACPAAPAFGRHDATAVAEACALGCAWGALAGSNSGVEPTLAGVAGAIAGAAAAAVDCHAREMGETPC